MSQPATVPDASTIDRTLVHRDALSEVFLTDSQPTGEDSYRATAQLPKSHAYFGDHLLRPPQYDPLLLLESCRQAALAGSHLHYGVPTEHKFILTVLSLRITHLDQLMIHENPGVLSMDVTTHDRRVRDGFVTGLDHTLNLAIDDCRVGQAEVGLRFKSPEGYDELRLGARDGNPPPLSSTQEQKPAGLPLYPAYVGRTDPDNVLLLGVQATDDGHASATLRIPGEHPSMFDHAQDHLPGMVLAEGARQLAMHLILETYGLSVSKMLLSNIDAAFSQFGELEAQTSLTATVGETEAAGFPVRVDVQQDGESIAKLDCTLTPTSPWPLTGSR
jgi:2-oxo-3-(phosphooxy)propyl 3-oxoalkanoate synthase